MYQSKKEIRSKLIAVASGGGLMLAMGVARADGDGGAVAALTAAGVTAAAVAAAALTVVIGIKVFKYIRQAL